MIKANELRIGNLIEMPADSGKPFWKVLEIKELGIIYGQSWETGTAYCKYDIPNPIPLTPEWLERLGYKYSAEDQKWFKQGSLLGPLYSIYDGFYGIQGLGIHPGNRYKCVHQLQNLYFALTGEELQIKMP
jgi:hypothetical protein